MKTDEAYQWLRQNSIETLYLSSAAEVLAWDQRTYIPRKGHAHRAEQMATLAKLLHERSTDPRIGERLADVEGTDLVADSISVEAANVREWRRDFDKSTKISERLAVELARATTEGETAWEKARPGNDWKAFEPHLARIIDLTLERAEALGYEGEPYDALLDDFEPGETAAALEPLFDRLREAFVALIERIGESSVTADRALLAAHFPKADQERFLTRAIETLGYDLAAGRVDVTAHPFTVGIGPGDVRITTRYLEDFLPAALLGAIHEAGHGMYEQGLPEEHWGTPAGSPPSLGLHESQSRMWENLVCRSAGFWRHAFPLARHEFDALADVDEERFVLALNGVEPSLIRVEADEVTYNLHILVRFELELGLLRRDLAVGDLPDAWRQKMKTYLGVEPEQVGDGAMQDVHWAAGLIGYFPTYTLGNVYAAQLYEEAASELGDLQEMFSQGEFEPLLGWLRQNVHRVGGVLPPRELIRQVTGSEPDPEHLIRYCRDKYGQLYDLG
jgi:carboxypeptidase Taq